MGQDDMVTVYGMSGVPGPVLRCMGHQSWVSCLSFDASVLQGTYRPLSGGQDTLLLLWDIPEDSADPMDREWASAPSDVTAPAPPPLSALPILQPTTSACVANSPLSDLSLFPGFIASADDAGNIRFWIRPPLPSSSPPQQETPGSPAE